MKFPQNNNYAADKGSPRYVITKYNSARSNLLLAIVFTALNMLLYAVGGGVYFLFSIAVPYALFGEGLVLSVIAVVILGAFLACYLLSKNKTGWMTAALVLFIIDTVVFLGGFVLAILAGEADMALDSVIDLAFHVWVLISLASGVKYGKKLSDAYAQLQAQQLAEAQAHSAQYADEYVFVSSDD